MTANANANGTTVPTGTAVPSFGFTEAPASINVRVLSPAGFDYQLTMRASRVGDVLNQAQELERWLLKHDWTPAASRPAAPSTTATTGEPPICPYHNKPMTRRSRDGRSWWSCNEKLSNDEWCQYRPKDRA